MADRLKTMPDEQVLNMMLSHWREYVFGEGKENDVLFINRPLAVAQSPDEDDIFAYSGYIKPGKHQIVIFDPTGNSWYEINNIVVDPREGAISTHKE